MFVTRNQSCSHWRSQKMFYNVTIILPPSCCCCCPSNRQKMTQSKLIECLHIKRQLVVHTLHATFTSSQLEYTVSSSLASPANWNNVCVGRRRRVSSVIRISSLLIDKYDLQCERTQARQVFAGEINSYFVRIALFHERRASSILCAKESTLSSNYVDYSCKRCMNTTTCSPSQHSHVTDTNETTESKTMRHKINKIQISMKRNEGVFCVAFITRMWCTRTTSTPNCSI